MPNITVNYGHWTYWGDYNPPEFVGEQKVTFDGPNRLILINEGQTDIDVTIDIYSAWKNWSLQIDNMKYAQALTPLGGDPITSTNSVGRTYFLENGWRIQPWPSYNGYILTITGNLYTREEGGNPTNPESGVSVNFTRSSLVELVTPEGGGGSSLTAADVWSYATRSLTASLDPTVADFWSYATRTLTASLDPTSTDIRDVIWNATATDYDTTGTMGNWVNEVHGQIRRGVFINTEEATNGNGYQQTPYNNFSDAVDSAESLLLQKLFLEADATVDRQLSNFEIEGIDLPTVDLNGQNFKNTIIRECNITGAQGTGNSPLLLLTCGSNNVTDFNGSALTLAAAGTFGIADGAFVLINEVVNAVAGVFTNIDMGAGGAASNLNMMKVMGDFQISNMDNASDTIDIGFQAGELTINSSCTAGTIVVHGNCVLIDNSGPGCTVVLDHIDPLDVLLSKELLEADQVFDQSAGLLHYYRKGTTTDLIPPKTVVTTQTQDTSLTE